MNPVALMYAKALIGTNFALSPPAENTFLSVFSVLVQNLAFDKRVSIWGHAVGTGTWSSYPCSYSRSVPGAEIWEANVNDDRIDQFAAEYQVLGNLFWDNNSGHNYALDVDAPQPNEGVGTAVVNPNLIVVDSLIADDEALHVTVFVKNIAFDKQVGILYTTNNWLSFQRVFGKYTRSFPPPSSPYQLNTESWEVVAPTGLAAGQFAAFYGVAGITYWDNNFGLNHSFVNPFSVSPAVAKAPAVSRGATG